MPQLFRRSTVVIAGVASNVSHVYADALAIPGEVLGQLDSEIGAVDIPINSADWFQRSEAVQNAERAEVSRMPDFIAFSKGTQDRVVQKAVGVREQPDSHLSCYRGAPH